MTKDIAFTWFGIMTILLGTSCIDEYVQEPKNQQTGILVIEGTITGDSVVTVYVSRTVRMDQTATTGGLVQGAEVYILCNDGTQSEVGTEVERGEYAVPYHALDMSKSYCLQVKIEGKIYQSEFKRPMQTPPIDSLYWYKDDAEAPVDIFVSTHDPNNQVIYYMWTFCEDWEIVSYYNTTLYVLAVRTFYDYVRPYEENPNPYYYCWNRMISRNVLIENASRYIGNQIIDYPLHTFPCTDDRVCYLYCISVTQQALDEEAYQYYQNKKKMTEEMGNIFSPMPSELQGNITCIENPDEPVIGYIHVSIPTNKRLFIGREEAFLDNRNCQLFTEDYLIEEHLKVNPFPPTPEDLLSKGYRYVYNGSEGIGGKQWARVECVECTAYGTKEKPDFWPNDHE